MQDRAVVQREAGSFAAEAARADELLDVKRHGRIRDHGILYCAKQEIEKGLDGPITYESLANLITAAQLAAGMYDEPASAQSVRQNLDGFLTRNPLWDPIAISNPSK